MPRKRLILAISLTALVSAAWIRSHFHADTLMHCRQGTRLSVGYLPGQMVVLFDRPELGNMIVSTTYPKPLPFFQPGFHLASPPVDPDEASPPFDFGLAGFKAIHGQLDLDLKGSPLSVNDLRGSSFTDESTTTPGYPTTRRITIDGNFPAQSLGLTIPFWPLIFAGWLPCLSLLRRSLPAHLCPHCRYDLRATPTQCPECGHRPAAEITRAKIPSGR